METQSVPPLPDLAYALPYRRETRKKGSSMMTEQQTTEPKKYPWYYPSTALTINLSLVVGITGIMMFLKIGEQSVREAHEWLGVAFVGAVIFHSIRHWNTILRYLRITPFWAITAPVIVATLFFIAPSLSSGGKGAHPMKLCMDLLNGARIEQIAEMSGTSVEVLMGRLKASGIPVNNSDETLRGLAETTNRPIPDILSIMVP
jgi:hypothetical protein